MRYSYLLDYGNGLKEWSIQDHLLRRDEIKELFKDVKKVTFHRHIPNGWHLCGCGNLVIGGREDELCDECKSLYGHTYESEL